MNDMKTFSLILGNLFVIWFLGLLFSPFLIGISRLAFFGWSWLAIIIVFLVWMAWSITHDGKPTFRFIVNGEESDNPEKTIESKND